MVKNNGSWLRFRLTGSCNSPEPNAADAIAVHISKTTAKVLPAWLCFIEIYFSFSIRNLSEYPDLHLCIRFWAGEKLRSPENGGQALRRLRDDQNAGARSCALRLLFSNSSR